jgi:hypothetical protein
MEKVIRDGMVAVIYSPGFGAGLYTWNQEHPDIIFDPMLVDLIETGKHDEAHTYATLRWPDAFLGGLDTAAVKWIPQGTLFRIHEYDGSESIEIKEDLSWMIA